MDKKVTPQQVEQLYAFTRAHFVEYYDLQTELADHLANAVEAQWQTSPALSFDDALAAVFKKFGPHGFTNVVALRQKALEKRYGKLMRCYFKQYLKLPRIIFTLLALAIVYRLTVIAPLGLAAGLLVLQLLAFIKVRQLRKWYDAKAGATGKRWMLEEIMFKGLSVHGFASSVGFCWILTQTQYPPPPYYIEAMALILVLFVMNNYITLYIIPDRAEKHLRETYPEYALQAQ